MSRRQKDRLPTRGDPDEVLFKGYIAFRYGKVKILAAAAVEYP
jgi:hypothetical protein